MDNETLDLIARNLRNYACILNAEGEKMELFGVSSDPSLFDRSAALWDLAEIVLTSKRIVKSPKPAAPILI